jgi:hypothetical protein
MKSLRLILPELLLTVALALLITWFSVSPTQARTLGSQGQNAVCTSQTGCSTTPGTSAFIDASTFLAS